MEEALTIIVIYQFFVLFLGSLLGMMLYVEDEAVYEGISLTSLILLVVGVIILILYKVGL